MHRDLKPSNILLTGTAADSIEGCLAKITDFGVAKCQHEVSCTRTGDILGTPSYMAPEQASGGRAAVGPAVDVYSLGAILYQLLTGRPPFEGDTPAETLMKVVHDDPARPSRHVRALPADLETICLKCLEKDPSRRYATALALADDLERFLRDEPVLAKPSPLLVRARRWTRRHPAAAVALVGFVGVVAVAFAMLAAKWRQASRLADQQRQALVQDKTRLAESFLDQGIHLAQAGDAKRALHWMVRSLKVAEEAEQLGGGPLQVASAARMNLAGWSQTVAPPPVPLRKHHQWITSSSFSPDGRFVATAGTDRVVQVWDVLARKPACAPLQLPDEVWQLAFHPSGRRLVTLSGPGKGRTSEIRVWASSDDAPGAFVPHGEPLPFPAGPHRLGFDPSGSRLFVVTNQGILSLWSFDPAAARHGLALVRGPMPFLHDQALFSPDGTLLVSCDPRSRLVHFWRPGDGAEARQPLWTDGPVGALAFSPDSKRVAFAANLPPQATRPRERSVLNFLDPANGELVGAPIELPGLAKTLVFAGDGACLAASVYRFNAKRDAVDAGEIQLFDAEPDGAWRRRDVEMATPSTNWSLAFASGGRLLLAGCEDRFARLFSTADGSQFVEPIAHEGCVAQVHVSPDGHTALTTCRTDFSTARLTGLPRCDHLGRFLPQSAPLADARWMPDGAHLWTAADGRPMLRWRVGLPAPVERWSPAGRKHRFAVFAPDGLRAFLQDQAGGFTALRLPGQQEIVQRPGLAPPPRDKDEIEGGVLHHFASRRLLRYASRPPTLQWCGEDGEALGPTVVTHEGDPWFTRTAVSPDGRWTAAATYHWATNKAEVVLYEGSGLKRSLRMEFPDPVFGLGFSPDSAELAVGGGDRQVQRYRVDTGAAVGAPLLHRAEVRQLAYLADGLSIATGTREGIVQIWGLPHGKAIGPPVKHAAKVAGIATQPGGRLVFSWSLQRSGILAASPVPVQGSPLLLKRWVVALTSMDMNADGAIRALSPERLLLAQSELAERGGAPALGD